MEPLSIASNNGVVSEEEGRDSGSDRAQERAPRSGLSNSGEGEAETGDPRKLCAAEGSTNDRERGASVSTESAPARVKDEVPELKSGVPELESVTIKEEVVEDVVCNGEEEETEVESLEVACMKDERFAEDHSDSNEDDRSSTASRAEPCKDRVDSIEAANLNTQQGTSTENAKCGGQDALKKTLPPRLQTEEKDGARVKNRRECKEREQSTRVQRHLRVKIRVPGGGGGGGERAYECTECQQSFETRRTFNLHKKSTHQAEFICSECGETFGKISALQKHQRIHAAEKPYPCPECGKNFRHSRALKRHVEIHRRVRRYPCNDCSKSFSRPDSLETHKLVHSGTKQHRCPECAKGFSDPGNLRRHQRIHTEDKPHRCSECGKSFSRIGNLEIHRRIHTGEKPYRCSECGKCFNHSQHLKTHLRLHSGEKPYPCPDCGKRFINSGALKTHRRIHTGEKPYLCSECGKSFNQSENLKTHLRIHSGEKPHACPECGKSFAQLENLKTHRRVHTGEKPYRCPDCRRSFSQSCHLKRHKCGGATRRRRRRREGPAEEPGASQSAV
ncbi:Zinc finger protein 253 [Acipenser ruthenus]|uniref:Zinc finger protein 253 n=1 Tax=Acipenser ruthenus TaxID=7906 RepID=A0A444UV98_ACIRT|nr:Zinc finger protein 253 [Acipenser ruthenus]